MKIARPKWKNRWDYKGFLIELSFKKLLPNGMAGWHWSVRCPGSQAEISFGCEESKTEAVIEAESMADWLLTEYDYDYAS